jgi:colanic acid/amylovoran biosynthesis protein
MILPQSLRTLFAQRDKELKDYVNATFIVDTSGDMLTEDYGPHVAFSHIIPLLYCVLLEKSFLIMAQSIGPFRSMKSIFTKILSKAEVITARDKITYDYLINIGLRNVVEVADLSFLLPAQQTDLAAIESLKKNGTELLIGICPSGLIFKKFKHVSERDCKRMFFECLDSFATKHNIIYVLIPHVLTPSRVMDDAKLCNEMIDNLKTRCLIMGTDFEPAQIKYLVSSLDMMVSFRMHGAIAGLDVGVPTIAVSYSHKTEGLYQNLGLEKWVVANSNDLANSLHDKMTALISERQHVILQLNTALPTIRTKAKQNVKYLEDALFR